jgi:hypothetical protein
MRLRRISSAFIALVFVFALTSLASADITPALGSVTPSGGGNFSWNYSIAVDSNEQLIAGSSYFTIYDPAGLISASAPAGWTVSTALIGQTPPFNNPPDDPGLLNVTFSYTTGPTITGPQPSIGTFSVISSSNTANPGGFFSYQAGKISGGNDGGNGPLSVPAVPEGSELGMFGITALGMLGAIKRKFVS